MPVKPLSFKGDKKTAKKRKHPETSAGDGIPPQDLVPSNNSAGAYEDDSWTSPSLAGELTGPTVIVLPTNPTTCLASDANGRIFASRLENMIEENPRTAEPHDVRQVWVATKMPGTGIGSTAVEIGFKGSHGGWLSCDSVGVLGAVREARGTEEGFILEEANDESDSRKHGWLLQTAATKRSEGERGKRYLCAVTETSKSQSGSSRPHDDVEDDEDSTDQKSTKISVALRGDGEADDDSSRLILRMQARFLPVSASAAAQQKSKEKISRQELEKVVGRRLEDDEVKRLKRAKRHGTYHEEVLDMRAKGSHDKYA